jgi:hypothetical protein
MFESIKELKVEPQAMKISASCLINPKLKVQELFNGVVIWRNRKLEAKPVKERSQ